MLISKKQKMHFQVIMWRINGFSRHGLCVTSVPIVLNIFVNDFRLWFMRLLDDDKLMIPFPLFFRLLIARAGLEATLSLAQQEQRSIKASGGRRESNGGFGWRQCKFHSRFFRCSSIAMSCSFDFVRSLVSLLLCILLNTSNESVV